MTASLPQVSRESSIETKHLTTVHAITGVKQQNEVHGLGLLSNSMACVLVLGEEFVEEVLPVFPEADWQNQAEPGFLSSFWMEQNQRQSLEGLDVYKPPELGGAG